MIFGRTIIYSRHSSYSIYFRMVVHEVSNVHDFDSCSASSERSFMDAMPQSCGQPSGPNSCRTLPSFYVSYMPRRGRSVLAVKHRGQMR